MDKQKILEIVSEIGEFVPEKDSLDAMQVRVLCTAVLVNELRQLRDAVHSNGQEVCGKLDDLWSTLS